MRYCNWRWSLALLLSLFASVHGAALAESTAPMVLVVTSERGGAYDELIAAMRTGVLTGEADAEVKTMHWNEFVPGFDANPRIIVTVGSRAAAEVTAKRLDIPVLSTLLPRETFAQLHREHPEPDRSGISAIFLDQPVSRQIALLAEGLPTWQRLALISGPHTRALADQILVAAEGFGFEVMAAQVMSDRELYSAMQRTLSRPAVLIALPDREIYNSHTIQNILLTSYRQRSPMIGFSPAYVRAGALLAIYSTPNQIGTQAAAVVIQVLRGGPLPPPRHADHFEVGINPTVARSFGISLDSAASITARIKQRETGND